MAGSSRPAPFGAGFLLAQLGAHTAATFASAIAPLGVSPPHIGLLRVVIAQPGRSQQVLADEFGMVASRMVVLLDALEERGLLERRGDPADRRVHLVHATPKGHELFRDAMAAGIAGERRLLAPLAAAERKQLMSMLMRIADGQGLTRGVHPGFRDLRPATSSGARDDPDAGHDSV